MNNILLSSGLAFLITFFAIPVIIQVAKEKKLFDEPDERKVHKNVIPTLGGLGIFAGFIIATLMGVPSATSAELQYIIAAITVVFFLGLKDDILILSASKKFIGQLIAAGIIIEFGDIQISSFHGFLGYKEIPHMTGVIISLFTIVVITNSFNLIDGVDGLAGSLGLLTTLIFGTYFFYAGELTYAVMSFALSGSIIGFLIFNHSPAKVFMGDTGSLLLGLVNSILVIKFINTAGNPSGNFPLQSAPAIGFSILMIPLFDTLRVFGLRIIQRRSPFSPDRTHVHHFLLDLGLSHRMVTITCVLVNITFILIAFFMRSLGATIVLGFLLLSAFIFIGIIYYSRPKNNTLFGSKAEKPNIIKSHKIFKVASEPLESD